MYFARLDLYDHTKLIGGAIYDDTGFGFHYIRTDKEELRQITEPLFTGKIDIN